MAVRFDAAADRLLRTSDLLDFNSPYTIMAWVYRISDLNAYTTIFDLSRGTDNANEDFIGCTADGTSLVAYIASGGAYQETAGGTTLPEKTWSHVAVVRESTTSLRIYLNGSLVATNTQNVASRGAIQRLECGAALDTNISRFDGRLSRIKAWSTNLTQDQVLSEMNRVLPLNFSNLYGFWPTFLGTDRTKDYSGLGRDWTAGGSLTDEDDAPVTWGGKIYSLYGVTSGITLTISKLIHGHTLDSPNLTPIYNLLTEDLQHGHLLDGITVQPIYSIIVDELNHTHLLDSPTLTLVYNLTVDKLIHTHSLDSPILTPIYSLIISELNHDQNLDNLNLIPIYNLVTDKMIHAHYLDGGTVIPQTLIVNELLHSHYLDGIETVPINLFINKLIHQHLLDYISTKPKDDTSILWYIVNHNRMRKR